MGTRVIPRAELTAKLREHAELQAAFYDSGQSGDPSLRRSHRLTQAADWIDAGRIPWNRRKSVPHVVRALQEMQMYLSPSSPDGGRLRRATMAVRVLAARQGLKARIVAWCRAHGVDW